MRVWAGWIVCWQPGSIFVLLAAAAHCGWRVHLPHVRMHRFHLDALHRRFRTRNKGEGTCTNRPRSPTCCVRCFLLPFLHNGGRRRVACRVVGGGLWIVLWIVWITVPCYISGNVLKNLLQVKVWTCPGAAAERMRGWNIPGRVKSTPLCWWYYLGNTLIWHVWR